MMSTAAQTMASLEHTAAAFAADTPAPTATEPALPFVCASRQRFPSRSRQNHASNASLKRRLFVPGRRETPIGGSDIRRAAEDRDVSIKGGHPQRHVRRSRRMDLIRSDDLMACQDGRGVDSGASAPPGPGPLPQSRPRPRAARRSCATTRATACARRAAEPRTDFARVVGADHARSFAEGSAGAV